MIPTPAPSVAPGSPTPATSIAPAASDDNPYPEAPLNFGPDVPFSRLAKLYDALSNEKKQARKRKLLEKWFNAWRRDVGNDLFPALRLILPQKDRERAVYGLKEKALAKVYIRLIPLRNQDPDAQRMLFWKKPTERSVASGDFPTVLSEVVQKRSSVLEGSLTIQELNDILERLSKNIGKSEEQARVLQKVYNTTTAEEQKWIVRIILKDMNISVQEKTVFGVFHPDAEDLYNACSDLKKISWQLWNPNARLEAESKEITLFNAFLPMLCQRPKKNLDEVVKEMGGTKFIVEEKLDGERMQLHKRGNEYFYCSRKGKNYTHLYGQTVGQGSLTPHIHGAFHPDVQEIILDGEMLVWDPISENHLPFGTLKSHATADGDGKPSFRKKFNPRPCFKVFDMLYLNGKCLTNMSVSRRKANMREAFKEVKGHCEYAIEWQAETVKDIRVMMDEVMSTRGEGLVVKHPGAKYVLNGRTNDWYKVKPEYMDNLGETVDVLVVGGNYGTGRRSGGVSTLVCAVIDENSENTDETIYRTFVRIGSGFSFADYVWIREKPWKIWDPKQPPKFLRTSKLAKEDKGDLYLEPEDSFIVKVKAAEYVGSEKYDVGFTLRFPRALCIRTDLTAADCMRDSEIPDKIRERNKRKIEDSDKGGRVKKRRKTTKSTAIAGATHVGADLKRVSIVDNLFAGYTLGVFPNDEHPNPNEESSDIMRDVKTHGGKPKKVLAASGDPTTAFYIYSGKIIYPQVQAVIKGGVFDIVKPRWITDSIEAKELVPLSKKYFFHASESRRHHPEYENGEGDDDSDEVDDDEDEDLLEQLNAGASTSVIEESVPTKAVERAIDPELSEWFNVTDAPAGPDENDPAVVALSEEEDNDSDGDDIDPDEEEDEWFQVEPQTLGQEDEIMGDALEDQVAEAKMGEDEDAMHYDLDQIFKHLCFYLDSPSNGHINGLNVKTKKPEKFDAAFAESSRLIMENGGRIKNLDDPKLTHVLIHKDDQGRRGEIMKRTSKPRHRNLVTLEWIEACLEEETLLPEEDFTP